jgi:SOS response regulatory protein OraA/RecX
MDDRRIRAAERRAARAELADVRPVLDAAGRYLEVRPRAAGEVRRHLVAAGYPSSLVEAAIVRLTDAGYLDDEAFARAWMESRDRSRPRGEAALRRELLARGVDADVVGRALAERRRGGAVGDADRFGGRAGAEPAANAEPAVHAGVIGGGPLGADEGGTADAVAARRLLERRGRGLLREADPRRRWQRAYALLARSGFDPGTCREAVVEWLEENGGDGEDLQADGD